MLSGRKRDAALTDEAFEAGAKLGIDGEASGQKQLRGALFTDRHNQSDDSATGRKIAELRKNRGNGGFVSAAHGQFDPAPPCQFFERLEALDRDSRLFLAGAAVEFHGQETALAGLGGGFDRGGGLVVEYGRIELAATVTEAGHHEAAAFL